MKPFITTFTGRKVNPLDLRPEDVSIRDIAHHLSCLNRFIGALARPISIAQHSFYVSQLLTGTGWEKEGLFHDAAEAYLGDVSKWVKQHDSMRAYRAAELQAWYSICAALDLRIEGEPDHCPPMREADDLMVRFEALQGFVGIECHMFELASHPKPTDEELKRVGKFGYWEFWSPAGAEAAFLERAESLGFTI